MIENFFLHSPELIDVEALVPKIARQQHYEAVP
jgi:hypothetical protein